MIYILLADGFEEIEMITPLDMLRRAGIPVQTVGITGEEVEGAHGIRIAADILPEDVKLEEAQGVILPGGMPGTTNLQGSDFVRNLVRHCANETKLVGAICAAPMILGELGLLENREAVCFPGFEEHLKGATVKACPVAVDGNVITARGAGAAPEFGTELVNYFKGVGEGEKLLAQMQDPAYV
ncbi:MAG: DJ-1/PfpI family protein [Clostridia bacterium]|nr:DJ-1/PfpI family protein [Clostridia bacterium]